MPAGGIAYDILLLVSQDHDARTRLVADQSCDTRPQSRCDPIEHENCRNFLAALDRGQHAATHLTAGTQLLKAKLSRDPLNTNPVAERCHVQTITKHLGTRRRGPSVHSSRISSFIGNASARYRNM